MPSNSHRKVLKYEAKLCGYLSGGFDVSLTLSFPSDQNQQESHGQTVSSLTEQLRDTRQELREKSKEKKESERAWQNEREDREREGRKLRDSLEKRDKLIEVKEQGPRAGYGLKNEIFRYSVQS